MALYRSFKLLFIVWLCSPSYAQLSSDELSQVEYQVDNEKFTVDIAKEGSTENESHQNIPKGNDIEEPFKTETAYCLGCAINVPVDQPGVSEMVERAVSAMDQIVAASTIHASPKVLSVQKQVVNGIQYYIQFEVSLSDCPQSTSPTRDQCKPLPDSPSLICEVTFLDQPWNSPKPQLMGNNCTDANSDNDVENYTPDDLLAVERSAGVENMYPLSQDGPEITTEEKQEITTVASDMMGSEDEDRGARKVSVGTGMTKEMDSSEIDLINELADIAVRTLNELEVGGTRKEVVDIIDARKQIVNGLMYHLVLRVGSKSCEDESDCQNQGWTSQSICNVQLHRSWAGDTPYKAKVVNSECEEAWEESRGGRLLSADWVSQDMYDPEYTDCIKAVLSKAYSIVPEEKVTLIDLLRQDVAPKTTDIIAELKLDSDKWTIPKPENKVVLILRPRVSCNGESAKSSLKVERNFDVMRGGSQTTDVRQRDAINFAVGLLNNAGKSEYREEVDEVILINKNYGDGIIYELKLRLVQTNCKKDDLYCRRDPKSPKEETRVCSMYVWSRMNGWTPMFWLNGVFCVDKGNSARTKRSAETEKPKVAGGISDTDKNSPEVEEAVEFAVRELDKSTNSIYKQVVVEVVEAKRQTVAGTLFHLKLKLSDSNCKKGEETAAAECKVLPNADGQLCSLKVWSRPWLNKTELTEVSCGEHRTKRSLGGEVLGGIRDIDKNSPDVRAAIEFAVREMDKSTNSIYQQRAIEVIEAKHQLVAGSLYYLKLRVAETNCRKNDQSTTTCEKLPNVDGQVCSLKVLSVPWRNEMSITDVSCGPDRAKRSLGGGSVPGGLSDVDKNSDEVRNVVDFAVKELDKSSNSIYKQTAIEVIDAKKQVVAGLLYHLKLRIADSTCRKDNQAATACEPQPNAVGQVCTLKVWTRPWLNETTLTDVNCGPARRRRSVGSVGAGHDANRNSQAVKAASDFAVQRWENSINSAYKHRVVEVLEAKEQIVSGISYRLKLKVEATNCGKEDLYADSCERVPTEPIHICTAKVWSKPWLNQMSLSSVDCQPIGSERSEQESQVGGLKEVEDLLDPYIQDIAEYSRNEIDKATNTNYIQKVVRVIEARKQVVSGVHVHMKLELIRTSCTKSTKDRSNCEALPNQKSQICEVKVWDRPWLKIRKMRDLKCSGAHIISSQAHSVDAAEDLFSNFVVQFNKTYSSDAERDRRFEIFQENLVVIKELQDTEQGTATYGPTMFADLTHEEFKNQYLGLRPDLKQENTVPFPKAQIPDIQLPKEFDWRDHNAVTPVKNQGMCGSCWAFAVTGDIEGQYAIKYKKLLSFSEQELVDCDKIDDGCQGGLPDNAYRALEQLGGLELEQDYPYDGHGQACALNKTLTRVHVHGALNISSNETDMAKWLVKNGPIAIGINANAMQFYMGGVSHPLKFLCNPASLDHGVLIVGLGEHRSTFRKKMLPYWLIKNSWGKIWGDQGYYRIYRGDGSCGVNAMASSAIIE